MKDYRELCIELFGTDDETELRKIAGRLRGGRKKALTEKDIAFALELQTKGVGTMGEDIYQLINKIQAKPFERDFDVQLDAAQDLYGNHLELHFTNQDIEQAFDEIGEHYSDEIIARAKELLKFIIGIVARDHHALAVDKAVELQRCAQARDLFEDLLHFAACQGSVVQTVDIPVVLKEDIRPVLN